MKIRKLEANEIECRVAQIRKDGSAVSLLLYKDARVDMKLMDEVYGAKCWQRKHELINGNLFCSVGVYNADIGEWIWKQDVGTESNTEKEKGQASDSFKRACTNWGIGRELYTAPDIWVNVPDCEVKQYGGKYKCYDRFGVKSIGYDENGCINRLEIVNQKTRKVVFRYPRVTQRSASVTQTKKSVTQKPKLATQVERKTFMDLCERLDVNAEKVLRDAGWTSGKMTGDQYGKAMLILKEIEESQA